MANTKSIKKIREYLFVQKEPVTISDISRNVNLRVSSIKDVLAFLQEISQVNIMASKGTTLVQIRRSA